MTTDKDELEEAIQTVRRRFIIREGTRRELTDSYAVEAEAAMDMVFKAARAHLAAMTNQALVTDDSPEFLRYCEDIRVRADLNTTPPASEPVTDAEAREALQALNDLEQCTQAGKLYPSAFETIRRALSRPASGMELPQLPDGWALYRLCETDGGENYRYAIQIWHEDATEPTSVVYGPTPRAAAEAAIAKIEKGRG